MDVISAESVSLCVFLCVCVWGGVRLQGSSSGQESCWGGNNLSKKEVCVPALNVCVPVCVCVQYVCRHACNCVCVYESVRQWGVGEN